MKNIFVGILFIIITIVSFASLIMGLYQLIDYFEIGFVGEMLKIASWIIAIIWWVMILNSTKQLFQKLKWLEKDKPFDVIDYFKDRK